MTTGRATGTRRQRPPWPALRDPRWRGDVDGSDGRRLRRAPTCWSKARRSSPSAANLHAGGASEDRRARPHRDAGLHRHPPPPVRDGAAQLPGRRRADQRRLGLAKRQPDLLRVHPAQVRTGVPAAGRVHQRAVRRPQPARRRRDDGARHLADPPLADALRRRRPGAVRHRPARRLRLLRKRRWRRRQPVPERRGAPEEAVVLLERPARAHDHGRRGLPRRCDDSSVVDDRAPARSADRGAHPLAFRHPADHGCAGHGPGRHNKNIGIGRTTCSST